MGIERAYFVRGIHIIGRKFFGNDIDSTTQPIASEACRDYTFIDFYPVNNVDRYLIQ